MNMRKIFYLLLLMYSSLSHGLVEVTNSQVPDIIADGTYYESTSELSSLIKERLNSGVCSTIDNDSDYFGLSDTGYRITNKGSNLEVQASEFNDSSCESRRNSYYTVKVYFQSGECPEGTKYNSSTNSCIEETCDDLKGKDAVSPGYYPDDGLGAGATRYFCDIGTMCEARHGYFASNGSLYSETYFTGNECVGSEEDYTNNPWYVDDTGETGETDGTGEIDSIDDSDGVISTPDVDPTAPLEVDPPELVESPDSGEVIDAIVNLNNDVNQSVTALNEDMNVQAAEITDELKQLNASNESVKEQIVQSEQTDIDIGNKTLSAIDLLKRGVEGEISESNGLLDGISGILNGIGDKLDGVLNALDGEGYSIGGEGFGTVLQGLQDGLDGAIEGYGDALGEFEELINDAPDIKGDADFNNGSYTGVSMVVRNQNVKFNLFDSLGGNLGLIKTVIVFVAAMIALFIVMSALTGGKRE